MASGAISSTGFVLKVLALLALIASSVVLLTDTVSVKVIIRDLTINRDGIIFTFKDVNAYKYMLGTSIIGAAYLLLQLPFILYHLCSGRRMQFYNLFPDLDFYGDQAIAFILGTGVSASLGVSLELKSLANNLLKSMADPMFPEIEESRASYNKFLNRGILATGLLSLGLVLVAANLIISSLQRSSKKLGYFFVG